MIIDAETLFSSAQAITASAKSTNTLDLGPKKFGTAGGEHPVEILVWVDTTFDSANDTATLTIGLRSSAADDMSSPVVHEQSPTLAVDSVSLTKAAAGANEGNKFLWKARLPRDCGRYVDLYYTAGTQNFTAGALSAAIVMGRQSQI